MKGTLRRASSGQSVLRQDRAFAEILAESDAYKEKWHLVPSRSVPTDAGEFSLYMCDHDWRPGIAAGCSAWDGYGRASSFEMLFCLGGAESIAQAIAQSDSAWQWTPSLQERDFQIPEAASTVVLVMELQSWPWSLVFELWPGKTRWGALKEHLVSLASTIHSGTGKRTIAISNTSSLDLDIGREPIREHHDEWYDNCPDDWLKGRGVFVPPFVCRDEDGFLRVWMAGTSIEEVTRLDALSLLLIPPD